VRRNALLQGYRRWTNSSSELSNGMEGLFFRAMKDLDQLFFRAIKWNGRTLLQSYEGSGPTLLQSYQMEWEDFSSEL
jgi:hypothetical protein